MRVGRLPWPPRVSSIPSCRSPLVEVPVASSWRPRFDRNPIDPSVNAEARRAGNRSYTSGMERKLATVLFVDLVDSTGLVTGSDPEVVRRRVQRYFDQVSRCVTMNGGIVEKFAGDAV